MGRVRRRRPLRCEQHFRYRGVALGGGERDISAAALSGAVFRSGAAGQVSWRESGAGEKGGGGNEVGRGSVPTVVGKSKGTWTDTTLSEGAVALGRIPIVLPIDGFDLNGTSILKDVKEAIEGITSIDLDQLFP